MGEHTYESTRRVVYGEDRATFIPVCGTCGRYVQADPIVLIGRDSGLKPGPNATCSKCGRIEMLFEGFI